MIKKYRDYWRARRDHPAGKGRGSDRSNPTATGDFDVDVNRSKREWRDNIRELHLEGPVVEAEEDWMLQGEPSYHAKPKRSSIPSTPWPPSVSTILEQMERHAATVSADAYRAGFIDSERQLVGLMRNLPERLDLRDWLDSFADSRYEQQRRLSLEDERIGREGRSFDGPYGHTPEER